MEQADRSWTRWTKKKRAAFLDELAGTCNVRQAAAAARVTPQSVYRLRRKDPGFVEEWHEALLAGYEMLETELLGHLLSGNPGKTITRLDGGQIDMRMLIQLLEAHRRSLQGKWRGGPPLRRADPEDTNKAILKKLEAIDRARALERDHD
ncbi:hypothetical protein OMP43_21450 [Sphingomonas sp. CBMAI 2297]|uniref:hypothetical protein n=1 Tax=Sphingomonas sp. CBMAI 2297 TaxID=2991720 RepID=UPI00245894E7|nr:hypothetical protein [Sphingomonas sp. CBMAI 2297]MDH4746599.1 hypothetical protein [Sphingomonas sp. CBMAI 2297]